MSNNGPATLYYGWANNSSGASIDVNRGRKETSQRAIENAARSELGSGWTVHVMKVYVPAGGTYGNPEEVKKFTIR